MRSVRTLCALSLLAVAAASPVRAQYRAEQFNTANGLPQNTVSGIAQTRDGYLWFSTYDGLARYDGVTITIFDRGSTPEMHNTLFTRLETDATGTLWGGTPSGVLRLRDGAFEWVGPVAGTPSAMRPGDALLQPGFKPVERPHWRVEHGSLVHTGAGERSRALPAGVSDSTFAHLAFEDRSGRLWIPTKGHGVWRFDDRGARQFARADGIPDTVDQVAGQDRDGAVWVVAHPGAGRIVDDRITWLDGETLTGSREIRASLVDRDGTLWLGTNERGVFRVSRQFLQSWSLEDGLGGRSVYPVLQDRRGRVWFGAGSSLSWYDNGRFSAAELVRDAAGRLVLGRWNHEAESNARAQNVRCLYEDHEGRLWVCAWNSLVQVEGGRVVKTLDFPQDGAVDAAIEDSTGAMWISTAHTRVMRVHGDTIERFGSAQGLNPAAAVTILYFDRDGRLLVGTRRGLFRREGAAFKAVTSEFSLDIDQIRALYTDSGGALWIGTFDNGVIREQAGKFAQVSSRNGLPSNGAFQILEDSHGMFWISSNRGIYRVRRQQLADCADGKIASVSPVSFGAGDGMRSVEANGGRPPAGWQARDGRLWFPTQDGVVVIDPQIADFDVRPPTAVFASVSVDGVTQASGQSVRLAPGQSDIEIAYTAPTSVQARDVRFRYRLGGPASKWIDAGTRRRVHFSHLAPGNYAFEVTAANGDGVWGKVPASLEVIVEPHFWQTGWFAATIGALLLATAGGGYQLRVRALKAREVQLQSLVDQRTSELKVANDRLTQLAVEDPLTGLANRRLFDEFLEREWQRSHRAHAPLSVLMMDVDYFKAFNDTYGHVEGDRVLKVVAGAVRETIQRATDLAARYGGEEFAVILTDTGEESARGVAESIRAMVAAAAVPHAASKAAAIVSVSIGVATAIAQAGAAPGELVAAADRALYRAKEAGRNRVG